MAAPKRTRGQREYDLILVSEMYLRGETQEAIAVAVSAHYEGFDLTRQQMGYDIKKLHGRWIQSQLINIDAAKARELARVDKIEREAWDAWERSKQDAETITTKGRGTKGAAAQMEKTIQLKGQVGDGSFLRIVQWCVEQRCKILGLDAPTRTDITSDGGVIRIFVGGIDLVDGI